jgi:enamine deaminase RidA (YjgF/YER057c/UK114 family)
MEAFEDDSIWATHEQLSVLGYYKVEHGQPAARARTALPSARSSRSANLTASAGKRELAFPTALNRGHKPMTIERIGLTHRYCDAAIFNGIIFLAGHVAEKTEGRSLTEQTEEVLALLEDTLQQRRQRQGPHPERPDLPDRYQRRSPR